ncbi:MAG TPA: hypothetical protein VJ866_00990 [Pyrinomonadaceae bacterium]|nr:hypothetical protein [Pyrinomonadaceae bacterium]
MRRLALPAVLLLMFCVLVACKMSGGTSSGSGAGSALSDPKSSIAYQFEQIKAGDVDKLKACLTPRVRDGVTKEVVDKAKTQAAQYTIDDLYASAEMGEADGKKTAKVKMKNGRTLTTLVETDGQWLADTIWFR